MFRISLPCLLLVTAVFLTSSSQAQNNRLESTGNVGIGTTAPVVKLSIYGPSDDSAAISLQSGTNSRFYIQQGGSILKIGGITPGIGVINVTNTARVGIGTSNPRALVDIGQVSTNTTTAVLARLPEGNDIGAGTYLGVQTYTTNVVNGPSVALEHKFYGALNSAINFYRGGSTLGGFITFSTSDGTEKMRIDANGNVGIGTANTSIYKLAVNGTIGAKRVKVEQETWADFVFEPEYKLPSLGEVEEYIKVNKHLPDVPSAKEVEKEGLDVGETDKRLLQKIEELTLYLIDQQKQLKAQQEQINILQDQNKALLNLMKKTDL